MASGNYQYQSDFAKKHQAAGRAEGLVYALLTLIQMRGLDLSAEDRARISACTDVAQLETWFRKAAVASSSEELF